MFNNSKDKEISPKWYLSTAVIIMTVLAVIGVRLKNTVPNQEIILQFTNQDVSLSDTQRTIAILEDQLQRIGIAEIQVHERENGKLIITYYSDSTIEIIKKLLSKEKALALGFVASDTSDKPLRIPLEEGVVAYHLNVYEIHDGQTSISSLVGKCAVEGKTGQHRFINPHLYVPLVALPPRNNEQSLNVVYTFQRYSALIINNASRRIPEVRAGPLS